MRSQDEAQGGRQGITNVVDSTSIDSEERSAFGQSGAGVEGDQVAEAWRINLTDDIRNTLESPFENVLRAGTAH